MYRGSGKGVVPFFKPSISRADIEAVIEVLESGWLTTGPKTKQFKQEFASFVGARYAVAMNSATAGLHLALEALGVTTGDVVAVPVFTFTATAEVGRHLDADATFVDINSDTLNIDETWFAEAADRNPRLKGIIPVHFCRANV